MTSSDTPEQEIRALIMTVGLPLNPKMDIAGALAKEIKRVGPEELVLLASEQSHRNAVRLTELLGDAKIHSRIIDLKSPNDLEEAFRAVNVLMGEFSEKGIGPDEIAINFTSGTKMMGSGAVLSGVFNRIGQLRYITGAEAGVEDRGRVVTTRPGAVFAYQDLLRARILMRELRFESATEVLSTIDDSLLTGRGRERRRGLLILAEAYLQRETFHPGGFIDLYAKAQFGDSLLEMFELSEDQLQAVKELAREVKKGELGRSILIELYNDGLRRLRSGWADDAATRVYRAMEVLAQWILKRDFDIVTDDVDTRRIPPRDRVAFEALRSMEDGMVKIGLRKAYDLLVILETPVGRHFSQSETVTEFLAKRSASILAHGLATMNLDDTRRLFDAVRELIVVEIEDFDREHRLLQFPWIDSENSGRG